MSLEGREPTPQQKITPEVEARYSQDTLVPQPTLDTANNPYITAATLLEDRAGQRIGIDAEGNIEELVTTLVDTYAPAVSTAAWGVGNRLYGRQQGLSQERQGLRLPQLEGN